MEKQENVNVVIFDGIITQRLIDIAKDRGIEAAKSHGRTVGRPAFHTGSRKKGHFACVP